MSAPAKLSLSGPSTEFCRQRCSAVRRVLVPSPSAAVPSFSPSPPRTNTTAAAIRRPPARQRHLRPLRLGHKPIVRGSAMEGLAAQREPLPCSRSGTVRAPYCASQLALPGGRAAQIDSIAFCRHTFAATYLPVLTAAAGVQKYFDFSLDDCNSQSIPCVEFQTGSNSIC